MQAARSANRVDGGDGESDNAKVKDQKKVAAGQAGAAARRAKQQALLEELRTAKHSLQPEAEVATRAAHWTPWILIGAGLAALCVTYKS